MAIFSEVMSSVFSPVFDGASDGASQGILTLEEYLGTGAELSLTGHGAVDLAWFKNRDAVDFHLLFDTTRGATNYLQSNSAAVEATNAQSLKTFDADGVTIGTQAEINTNAENYIFWGFKKDEEAFDIVDYTGDGAPGHNIPHNLIVPPELIIDKDVNVGNTWRVFHKDLNAGVAPEDYLLQLSETAAEALSTTTWDSTAPTSSVFTVGDNSAVNANTRQYIAYLFASKAGVSKTGTYSGLDAGGNSVTGLGFSPRLLLGKASTAASDWFMFDSARGSTAMLFPNLSNSESGSTTVTFDSDGFTLTSGGGLTNSTGVEYIYLALA